MGPTIHSKICSACMVISRGGGSFEMELFSSKGGGKEARPGGMRIMDMTDCS